MKRLVSFLRRGVVYWLPLALLLGLIAAHIVIPSVFERFSLYAYDAYQRLDPRVTPADPPVVIVDIDERSLHEFGQWPWPRTVLAQMLDKLREAGAAVVGFDVLFGEPDRTSPEALRKLLTDHGVGEADAQRLLAQMPDPDTQFAEAMAKAPVVLGFNLSNSGGKPEMPAKAGFAVIGALNEDPYKFVDNFLSAVKPLPQYEKAAAGMGFVNEPSDWDNIVRRVPIVFRLEGRPVPSLAAETLRVGLGARGYKLRYAGAQAEKSFGENTGLNAVEIQVPGARAVTAPIDDTGRIAIHYAPRDPRRYISAADIVSGNFDPKRVADHIVLVGSSAAGLNDLKATPIAADMPGVEVHAQLLEQILDQDFLFRPDWGPGAEVVFSLLAGLILVFAIPRFGAFPGAIVAAVAMTIAVAVSWSLYKNGNALVYGSALGKDGQSSFHALLDPVYPIIVLITVYVFSTLLNYRMTERQQREIRNAFSMYLSPHQVDILAKHPERLQLGGEIRMMTIMFCDIRGFTSLSEGMTSHELGVLINEFLTPMTEIIMEYKGTVDKYIGDCIMAFWNAPLDDPDHAKNAVAAAQDMRKKLVELNAAWEAEGRRTLNIGIGVNTGECSVGNFGSNQRMNYSLLGDPVNLSSRLEGQTKAYHVDLIIGEDTAALLDDPNLVELDLIAVKGKTQAVRIFTLPPHLPEAQRFLDRHGKVLAAYRRRDWAGALGLMADPVLADSEMAPLYGVYRERIALLQAEPPPSDWDGVYVAHEK